MSIVERKKKKHEITDSDREFLQGFKGLVKKSTRIFAKKKRPGNSDKRDT